MIIILILVIITITVVTESRGLFKGRRGYRKKCMFAYGEGKWEVTVFTIHHFLSGFKIMKHSSLNYVTSMRKVHLIDMSAAGEACVKTENCKSPEKSRSY